MESAAELDTMAKLNRKFDDVDPALLTEANGSIAVDIVITIYGAAASVRETLTSVFEHRDRTIPIHVILVSDGEPNDSIRNIFNEFSTRYPNEVTIIIQDHKGYTFAVNEGVREFQRRGRANFVCILNSDVVVTRGWLESLLSTAMSDSRIAGVGPLSNAAWWQSVPDIYMPQLPANRTYKPPPAQMNFNKLESFNLASWTVNSMAKLVRHLSTHRYPRLPMLNGFCMLFKKHVFERVGLFDEVTFGSGYGEENDLALRIGQANMTLAIDDTTYIYHYKSMSFGHDMRKNLSAKASVTLRSKYTNKVVDAAIRLLNSSTELDPLRAAMRTILYSPIYAPFFATNFDAFKILYLLPVASLGGGQISVVQETIALRRLGVAVKLALPRPSWPLFTSNFPDLIKLDILIPTLTKAELESYAGLFDMIVSTVYHTVASTLEPIHLRFPNILPAYYVQDYEPSFFPVGSDNFREAEQSYQRLALWGGLMFAKTEWLRSEVLDRQNVLIHKVTPVVGPILDTVRQFDIEDDAPTHAHTVPPVATLDSMPQHAHPHVHDESRPLRVIALIRPATPRRNAVGTLSSLISLKETFGSAVRIRTFGCSQMDFQKVLPASSSTTLGLSRIEHLGVLNRTQIGEALFTSDVFIDLSEWQAFGRTSVEAMIHGCVCIVPNVGGFAEFAREGYNSLIIEPKNTSALIEAVEKLINDRRMLVRMQRNAMDARERFGDERGAQERLDLFKKAQTEWLNNHRLRRNS